MSPMRILALMACTFVLSLAGVLLLALGVHSSQVFVVAGGFLLLPSILLKKAGLPVGIPLISSESILSTVLFVVLQAGYYYLLFLFVRYTVNRVRRMHSA